MESTISAGTARVRAADALRRWIAEGRLAAGSVVPSERDLAVALQASQPSVHRALALLEAEGLVVPGVGRERRVRSASRSGLMSHVLVVLSSMRRAKHHRTTGFSDHIAQAAHDAAAEARWHSLAAHPGRFDAEVLNSLLAERPAALVLPEIAHLPGASAAAIQRLRTAGIAVAVNADGPVADGADRACADHAAGCGLLVNYAAKRGRSRILPVWEERAVRGWWHPARAAGLRASASTAGVYCGDELVVRLGQLPGDAWGAPDAVQIHFQAATQVYADALAPILSGPHAPDAICVHTDADAAAVGAACRRLGREPGHDLDVYGYDGYLADLPLRMFADGLVQASVDRDNPAIGRALVELAIARCEGRLTDEPVTRYTLPRLMTTF